MPEPSKLATRTGPVASLLAVLALLAPTQAFGQYAAPRDEEPVFSYESDWGPIEYRAGRGFSIGDTGFNVGGFTTLELDREQGGSTTIELDAINLLLLYRPIEEFKLFADLEVDQLFAIESPEWEAESSVGFVAERLYGEVSVSDRQNFRFGKFQTPVGRWNLVPTEPFVWTAISPVLTDVAFDEHQTGVMFFGSLYPDDMSLTYTLYGQVVDPLEPDSFPPPADRSVGGRLELDDALGDWSLGSSFVAAERRGKWSYLGGIDGVWHGGPFELTGELVYVDGQLHARNMFGFYLQGVYELFPSLHAVARYEHFAPEGKTRDSNIGDVGLAWIPLPYLYVKADYRFVDRSNDTVELFRGLSASVSVLF